MNNDPGRPFFVKSLENVQGDERDAMIISVGYGKDADGHLTLNFGPLNMEGGSRRLNVLVTRAKWQTIRGALLQRGLGIVEFGVRGVLGRHSKPA